MVVVGVGMSDPFHQLRQVGAEVFILRALDGFLDAHPSFSDHAGRRPHILPHRLRGGRIADAVGMIDQTLGQLHRLWCRRRPGSVLASQ